jgi:hypothetical protein
MARRDRHRVLDKIDIFPVSVALAILGATSALAAEEYPKGHGPLLVFGSEAFVAMPLSLQLWTFFLVSTFAAGLFFVRSHVIARWAVVGFIVTLTTGHAFFWSTCFADVRDAAIYVRHFSGGG